MELYETYNPGAVSRVEVLGTSDDRLVVYEARAEPMSGVPAFVRRITFRCTVMRSARSERPAWSGHSWASRSPAAASPVRATRC